jgi:hypothetical protein
MPLAAAVLPERSSLSGPSREKPGQYTQLQFLLSVELGFGEGGVFLGRPAGFGVSRQSNIDSRCVENTPSSSGAACRSLSNAFAIRFGVGGVS